MLICPSNILIDTPRRLYFLHTLTWLLNMFGIFFILAAHEHYSIDVFVAFYITSRLFLYYHTLANNQALMQRDSTRTRIWFPMFSYFESSVNGIVPNEYDTLDEIARKILHLMIDLKDFIMLTAYRVWLETPRPSSTLNGIFTPKDLANSKQLSSHTGTLSTQTTSKMSTVSNAHPARAISRMSTISPCINFTSESAALAAVDSMNVFTSSTMQSNADMTATTTTTTKIATTPSTNVVESQILLPSSSSLLGSSSRNSKKLL